MLHARAHDGDTDGQRAGPRTAALLAGIALQPDSDMLPLAVFCSMAFGFMVPDRVLERLAARRVFQLRRGLPAAIDLMVLAVEAGQSLDASIVEASRGLRMTANSASA